MTILKSNCKYQNITIMKWLDFITVFKDLHITVSLGDSSWTLDSTDKFFTVTREFLSNDNSLHSVGPFICVIFL